MRLFCNLSEFSNEEATDGPFSDTSFGDDECRLAATFISRFCVEGVLDRLLLRVSFVLAIRPEYSLNTLDVKNYQN